ncbi:SERINC3_1 [Blepharisma stoltei]|uniref:Serine incorporator n=1 Tax=Blepharisma stoltei TaxID=1481888 RepID=A0AAU9JMY8_9CILI|nr:unnamed protein product [Blepharisma stoltei]
MGLVASCASSAICCAGSACCNCMCGTCMKCCKTSHHHHMRLGYLVLMIIAAGFGILFLYEGKNMMTPWTKYGLVNCDGNSESVCLGVQTVYRESFALALFFLLMLFLSIPGGKFSAIINQGAWIFKTLIIIAIFIITFFIDNAFFDVWREICRYVSMFFLVIQIIILIDFAYTWNEDWLNKYEVSSSKGYWGFCLFFFSGLAWSLSITIIALCYYWFGTSSECGVNIFLITLTLALGSIFTVMSLTPLVENGSLLTSSIVNIYIVWLCWYGLVSDTSNCNSWNDTKSTGLTIAFGLLVLMIMLLYISFREIKKSDKQTIARDAAEVVMAPEDEGNEKEAYKEDEELDRRMVYFHVLMIIVSMYYSMLLTNWGAANVDGGAYDNDNASMWVKFVALWTTVLLYVWSLIAPKVCKNRDFSSQI